MRTSSIALLVILSAHETPRVHSQGRLRGSKNRDFFELSTTAPFSGGSTKYLGDRKIRRRIMGDDVEHGGDREIHSNMGSTCVDQRVTKTWNNIKLSPDNSIPRSTGLDSAFGTASVSLVRSESCRVGANFEVCISADLHGSLQWRLHLTRGRIITNGPAVADFSHQMHAILSGMNVCTPISETLFIELTNAPDEFHVTAIADDKPNAVETQGIRGQLVQGFKAVIHLVQKSTSNQKFMHGASGKASISVESAGQMICFDAILKGFDSSKAQLHSGEMETSGGPVMDLSPTKVGAGRFLGCRSIETLGIDIETVLSFLADGERYYLDFALAELQDDLRASLGGQLQSSLSSEGVTARYR